MLAYDSPSFVSGHGLFSFRTHAKGGPMIPKTERQMLKYALLALTLAVIGTIYPI